MKARTLLLALLPLALLAILLFWIVRSKPADALRGAVPPTEVLAFTRWPKMFDLAKGAALGNIKKSVQDPVLREKLTPTFQMGCKRVLLSDDYYPALAEDNVEVVTDPGFAPTPQGFTVRVAASASGPFAASGTFPVV